MDAKERLRIYLEQRREVGESELVLDGMPVDDVMALLGARQVARPGRTARAPVSAMVPPSARTSDHVADDAAKDATDRGTTESAPVADTAVGGASIGAAPPAPPDVRFDAHSNVNWRDALRDTNPAMSAASGASAPTSIPAVLPEWLKALGLPAGVSTLASATSSAAALASNPLQQAIANSQTLEEVAAHIRACTQCSLQAGAKNAVPGIGNVAAEFVCVGEAPGASEDEQGIPFVGEAGQLLTKILGAIQLAREDVFICNVLKHRPPANRDPLPDEVTACQPFLHRQLAIVRPRVILALGRFAAQTLFETTASLSKLRGQIHSYRGIPVIVTYHPAALLRNESWKRPTWEDVKLARRILDASRVAQPERA